MRLAADDNAAIARHDALLCNQRGVRCEPRDARGSADTGPTRGSAERVHGVAGDSPHAVRAEQSTHVRAAPTGAFAHPGPALVDLVARANVRNIPRPMIVS
jgi:hypothetical protein